MSETIALITLVRAQDAQSPGVLRSIQSIASQTTPVKAYFLIAKEACLDVDDQPVIVCANFDITALRLAERALRNAQGAAADE